MALPPEVRGTVEAPLVGVTAPTRLSALLGAVRPAGEAAAELLGLSVLHAFDSEDHGLEALTDGVALADE